MIPVFLSSDNNYAPYLAVVLKSICENTKSSIDFYILDCGIEDSLKNIITELVSQYAGDTVEFINTTEHNIFSECQERGHVTRAAFTRLLFPYLKPQIDKAVYLDVDLIVNLDIAELYNQNIDDYIIGAVFGNCDKYYNHDIQTKKALDIDMEHDYFGSGVMVINCKKWRENNITQKLKDIYDKYEDKMIHNDQDILNIMFSNNKYYKLDKNFNYIVQYPYTENPNVIYHYDGPSKPWLYLPNLDAKSINYIDIWWDYAKSTECYELIKEKCIYRNTIKIGDIIAPIAYNVKATNALDFFKRNTNKTGNI